MNLLLDTNAWIRLTQNPSELSTAARQALIAETTLALSPISIIEVAQLQTRNRLSLTQPLEEWMSHALPPFIQLLEITPAIACDAYRIPDFHGDPADRIIAATARTHHLTLVTSDKALIAHTEVKTLSSR